MAEKEGISNGTRYGIWVSKLILWHHGNNGATEESFIELFKNERLGLLEPLISYDKLVVSLANTNYPDDPYKFMSLVTKKWNVLSYEADRKIKRNFRFFKNSILIKYYIRNGEARKIKTRPSNSCHCSICR